MGQLLIVGFILGFHTTGYAKDSTTSCQNKFTALGIVSAPNSQVCLSSRTTYDDALSDQKGISYVLVEDARDLNLSSKEIKYLFANEKFILVIDGFCAGKCSRLLLPLASKSMYTKESFAVLTDSSLESRNFYLGKSLLAKTKGRIEVGIKPKHLIEATNSYLQKIQNQYITDLEIISQSKTNITHLTWHSYVRQSLMYGEGAYCVPINSLAIILTQQYMNKNSLHIKGTFSLPPRNVLVNIINKTFPENTIIMYSYGVQPLHGCQ